jgi:hypothetical protein
MFSRIRKRLTYANVAMTLALVFAMSGGAYAASKYLITSTKQISPKVLKALKGANGKTGAAGANGANGAQGTAGANGKDGTTGTNGKDGVSVASSSEPKGANCAEGGSKFSAANGTTYACNGKNGTTGFTETLPSEKTETGAWALSPSAEGKAWLAISFDIPLANPLDTGHVHFVEASGDGTTCPGTVSHPKAEPGNLCVYKILLLNMTFESIDGVDTNPGASTIGALLPFEAAATGQRVGLGSWAVTAP